MRRILVIGQRLNRLGGGGITLSNLLSGVPHDCIYSLPLQNGFSDLSICSNVYELSGQEIKYFGIKNKSLYNNIDHFKVGLDLSNVSTMGNQSMSVAGTLRRCYRAIIRATGLDHYKHSYFISDKLRKWLNEIDVDVIYAQFSTLSGMRFVMDLVEATKKPLIVHIMDDWIETVVDYSLFSFFIRKQYNATLLKLFHYSKVRLAISQAMAIEYQKLYGYEFQYISNYCIVEDISIDDGRAVPNPKDQFVVGYFGRVGTANRNSIKRMSEAVSSIPANNIRFVIYTGDSTDAMVKGLECKNVFIYPALPYKEYFHVLKKCDLLYLPLDFDKESLRFSRLSIPTKYPEYLASGVPILVNAPRQTALAMECLRAQVTLYLGENSINSLRDLIIVASKEPDKLRCMAIKAHAYARTNYSRKEVLRKMNSFIQSAVAD